jgi:hypothetical protein
VSEQIIAIPSFVTPLTHLRGALISNSLQVLREKALFEQYLALLPTEHHDEIVAVTPSVWVPVSLGEAHYAACDGLGLSPREQFDFGYGAAARIHGTVLATVAKLATGAGVTPWTGLGQVDKLYARSFRGGATGVKKLGPKEARVDVVGFQLARFVYIRHAFRGVCQAAVELFSKRAYVRELTEALGPRSFALKFSWA